MQTLLLFVLVLALAYANGANDNFKGVATLYGGGSLSFRRALAIASAATAAGALASTLLASRLVENFSGRGLVGPQQAADPVFLLSTAGAAALTILFATWIGMPTSTTHALTGSLIGAALVQGAGPVPLGPLMTGFLLPLLLSPLLAIGLSLVAVRTLALTRAGQGSSPGLEADCFCVGLQRTRASLAAMPGYAAVGAIAGPSSGMAFARGVECDALFPPGTLRLAPRRWLDALHASSAGAVCFARALNDTPKIAALLLVTAGTGLATSQVGLVAGAMLLGGFVQSRKVAETMSRRITSMSPTQGLMANLVTATLVLGASPMGLPVSTTHVSVGALFGLGAARRTARWRVVRQVLATWLITLPLALVLSAATWSVWASWSQTA